MEKLPHGLHAVTHRPLAIAIALGETKGATDLSGGQLPRSLDADESQAGWPAGRDNHGQAAPVRGRLRDDQWLHPGAHESVAMQHAEQAFAGVLDRVIVAIAAEGQPRG